MRAHRPRGGLRDRSNRTQRPLSRAHLEHLAPVLTPRQHCKLERALVRFLGACKRPYRSYSRWAAALVAVATATAATLAAAAAAAAAHVVEARESGRHMCPRSSKTRNHHGTMGRHCSSCPWHHQESVWTAHRPNSSWSSSSSPSNHGWRCDELVVGGGARVILPQRRLGPLRRRKGRMLLLH